MRKSLIAVAIAGAFSLPSVAMAQAAAPAAAASPHTFTGNVGLFSDYRFRGISQTFGKPAVQGGFDYANASGFYLGTWASNVYAGSNAAGAGVNYNNGNMEWDFYGGFKRETAGGVGFDIGALHYYYPGANYANAARTKYDNTELYGAVSYKWFSAKYSRAVTDYFGINTATMGGVCGIEGTATAANAVINTTRCFGATPGDSKGSGYLDLNANFEVGEKLMLGLHVGRARVKNYSLFDYTDYKISLTKEYNGFNFGAAYVSTNAKQDMYRTAKTTGAAGSTLDIKDMSKGTLVLSVTKSF